MPPQEELAPIAEQERLRVLKPLLGKRARLFSEVRTWFREKGFLEVETPVRVRTPALEDYIDAIASEQHFLRTSPELHMKRMLGAGYDCLYQVGPCFRREESGLLHRPEFTMLEWYRTGDYLDILADVKALLLAVAQALNGGHELKYGGRTLLLGPEWITMTVSQAFIEHAGWDPLTHFDGDRFDRDCVERIEPALAGLDRPAVLLDWPAERGSLALRKPGEPRVVERWELYLGGLELANAFSELTDAAEQRRRFEQCARARRQRGQAVYPLDENFLAALDSGLPPCGGAALGLDRLTMLFCDAADIAAVRAFDE